MNYLGRLLWRDKTGIIGLLLFGLVVVVIFIFLRSLTATLIPSLTLPVTIVATFAVMYLLK